MIATLAKIGEQLLEGKGVWARLTTEPKFNLEKKNWVCPILFDCVNKEIRVLKDEMELFFPEKSSIDFRFVPPSIWGPRGKKCALTVALKNFDMLSETLFGKEDGDDGTMTRAMEELPGFADTELYKMLKEINVKLADKRSALNFTDIKNEIGLGQGDEIVLFYGLILLDDSKHSEAVRLIGLDGYDEFMISKFGSTEKGGRGLDYITGNEVENATEANFAGRYNIHKIFQTSTFNYASGLSSFKNSFQGDADSFAALDKASEFVLNKWQTRIAGVTHIVIPNFRQVDLVDFTLQDVDLFLDKAKDLLFGYQALDKAIELNLPRTDLFWINFIAFESDGNSFKVMNHIKDVNSYYLANLTETFARTALDFHEYIGGKYLFNLQTLYNIIPVRDGTKSKVNPVLALFKDILEQKKINGENLFSHFIDLSLCHQYGRYAAFKNIRKNDSFDFAIKDAVFKYSALIYNLKQLKLLRMENEKPSPPETEKSGSDYQSRIQVFFEKMEYLESEKALFYLGRILSSVAYAQYKKGHESKPVLNKVNFNGMDVDGIMRLSLDLREKTRQYKIHDQTEWNFSEFTNRFSEKDWPLSKEQNVFYLMAGYSFGLTKSDDNQ